MTIKWLKTGLSNFVVHRDLIHESAGVILLVELLYDGCQLQNWIKKALIQKHKNHWNKKLQKVLVCQFLH